MAIFSKPKLIVENLTDYKDIRILGVYTLGPGEIADIYEKVELQNLPEDVVLRGLQINTGDLYVEQVIKKSIRILDIDLPSLNISKVSPSNIQSSNSYTAGQVPVVLDDNNFIWIDGISGIEEPLQNNSGIISIPPAGLGQDGYLTKEDYATFLNGIKRRQKIWQYQDFSAPVGSSVVLNAFENGTGMAFDPSYIIDDNASVTLVSDTSAPPTSTLVFPNNLLPGSRVTVSSQTGTTVVFNQAPDPSLNVRVFYLTSIPADIPLPVDYQEDPEFLNDATLDNLDEIYVNRNKTEDIYGVKTFEDVRTSAFQLSTNPVDGYVLVSDEFGFGTWQDFSGAGSIGVKDEGSDLGSFTCFNFIGDDVSAIPDATDPNCVNIYIPPPAFVSHWNTSDGSNGDQSVSESISRSLTRISTPSGGEGSPFSTGGWAGTNQSTTLNGSVTFTTPAETTGFGGDSTFNIIVYDADGTTVLDSFTTPALTSNGVYTSASGFISLTLSGYSPDTSRFKASASVFVDISSIFSDAGRDGGRYSVVSTHTVDSISDDSSQYTYIQSDVFYDTNPTTPSIPGTVGISETAGSVLTKHLSGIEYYILNSAFSFSISEIDQLNKNTQATSENLQIRALDYGISLLSQSPFGSGSANFSGWSNEDNIDNVSYLNTSYSINDSDYRYIGTSATGRARVRDTWNQTSFKSTLSSSILVDTFLINSTNLFEPFDDEDRRLYSDYTTPWNSETFLLNGEALVQNGKLQIPSSSTLIGDSIAPQTNWSSFKPDLNGSNPDYTGFSNQAEYFRIFNDTSGLSRSNMTLLFTGDFTSGDATADLAAGNIEIEVRKIAGLGNFGTGSPVLNIHGSVYNFATFDDGNSDGQIRLASSSGNTVEATFGGFNLEDGFYCKITIVNPSSKIDSITVSFS